MQTKNRRIPISKSLLAGWPSRLLPWALAMLVLAFGPAAQAQQSTATIVGNVVDTTRAVVVGATIKITNTATGTVRSTVTDGVGQYTIPSLPVGTYMLSIDMQGFQSQRIGPITLDASQTARQNFELRAGKVTEVVEVEASNQAALLQTENASLGDVVDSHKIEDLPLNGRDFVQLAQLIPGANSGTPNSISARRGRGSMATSDAAYGSTSLEVDGARDTQNRYSIDGIEAMDYDGFTFNFSPSIDAIAEFRVDTSTSGTETTGAAGASVNLIVKSGANKFHGTLWEFNRNSALAQSHDALANVDVSPARLNQNQFGGNLGGPVYIPHIYNGHKKTFFFFNMERGTQLNGALPSSTTVPDAAVRSGNIDELITGANAANPSKPLINPYTGSPFVLGQKITVDPKSAAMLQPSITPLPNMTPTGSSTNNYLFPTPKTLNHQTDIIVRIDHSIGTKDTINGHFIYDDTYSNGTPSWVNSNDNNDASTKHLAISEVHVFSPILVNEIRYGNNDFHEVEKFGTTGNSAYNISNGMMQIPLSSSDPRYFGPPNIGINSVGTGYALFNLQRQIGPRNRANKINQLVDSVSYQRGKHFLKFGADVARRADDFNLVD